MVPVTTNQSSKMCFCSLSVLSVLSVLLWLSGSSYQSPPAIKHDGKSIWKPSFIKLGWFSFRKTFINLHYFVAFPIFSQLFLWIFPWFFRWIQGKLQGFRRSACNMQFFPTANGLMLSGSTLMASRRHAVSGNPWDVLIRLRTIKTWDIMGISYGIYIYIYILYV